MSKISVILLIALILVLIAGVYFVTVYSKKLADEKAKQVTVEQEKQGLVKSFLPLVLSMYSGGILSK